MIEYLEEVLIDGVKFIIRTDSSYKTCIDKLLLLFL